MANKNIKNNFQWIQLQEGGDSDKYFDGVAAGTFIDFYGRRFTIAEKDLAKFVENTRRVIASATTESGELVGLPIDVADHAQGDGAGWIKDLELAEDRAVIRFLPKWNDVGRELISGNIRRFFSPTIDLSQKAIMGGTLTNWPASRDGSTGEIMLRPIELSNGVVAMGINKNIASLADDSLNDRVNDVWDAYLTQYGAEDWTSYPVDIFEDHIVARSDGKLWRISYSMDEDGAIEFAPSGDWVEVEITYVEAAADPAGAAKFSLIDFISRMIRGSGSESVENTEKEVVKMADKNEVINAAAPESDQTPSVVELVKNASEAELVELAANPAIAKMIEDRSAAKVEQQRREDAIAQFSKSVTRGDESDKAEGLPVPADRLEKFLLGLDEAQSKEAMSILEHVAKTGMVALSERGHTEIVTGSKPLPDFVKASLDMHVSSGGSVDEFFKINAVELGDQRDYDLSAYDKQPAE